jgi:hypothetical protein
MSNKQDDLIAVLQETFNNLRKYNMMLNPMKCVFGVPAGQLLGFIVSHRGIEVSPEKIKAILDISQPNDLKGVQRLTGCRVVVSRFISHLGEKALPLYKLMKKSGEFVWTYEADAALKDLKRVLSTAPVLAAPEDQEPMLLYMAATNRVVSIVIIVVGMTIWVGQGQSHLPADIPGITMVLGQRGRLQPKDRLRQQPADDFTIRSLSRRRRRNSSNGRFTNSGVALTRSTEVGDKREASHAWPPRTNGQDPPPRKDPRQSWRHML